MANLLIEVLAAPVRWYQKHISPGLPRRCRYYPTCSEYTLTALQVHGPFKGLLLGVWRFMRCNPWSLGGVDHVPEKGRWKSPEWIPPDDWAGHDIEETRRGFRRLRKKKTAELSSELASLRADVDSPIALLAERGPTVEQSSVTESPRDLENRNNKES